MGGYDKIEFKVELVLLMVEIFECGRGDHGE